MKKSVLYYTNPFYIIVNIYPAQFPVSVQLNLLAAAETEAEEVLETLEEESCPPLPSPIVTVTDWSGRTVPSVPVQPRRMNSVVGKDTGAETSA